MRTAGSNGRAGRVLAPVDTESTSGPSAPEAPLTVAAVAARLGVAASTLRTWDRRYGLGPTSHEAGSHRRYAPQDVSRLEHMRRLTLQGVAPSDAARAALSAGGPSAGGPPQPGREAREHQSGTGPTPRAALVDPLTIAAAAIDGDGTRLRRLVRQVVDEHGLVRAWTEHVRPAGRILGQRDRLDLPGAAPQHFLDQAVLEACRAVALRSRPAGVDADPDANGRAPAAAEQGVEPGTPDPQGTVAQALIVAGPERLVRAHVIAAELTRRGVTTRVGRPGGEAPDEIRHFLATARPCVLALVGQVPGAKEIVDDAGARSDLEVYLLGRDAADVWAPHVHRVATVSAAVDEIAAACGTE